MQTDKRIGGLPPADPEAHTMSLERSPGRGGVPGCGVRPHPQDEEHPGQSGFYTNPQHEIWPALGFAADKRKLSGAWRLWELARHITSNGLIPQHTLRIEAERLGVARRTFYRWREQALDCGLLKEWGDGYNVTSAVRAVRILKPPYIEPRKIAVQIEDLFTRGWKRWLFDAHRAAYSSPVSRYTTQKLTGVSGRSQRRFEKALPIEVRRNVLIYDQKVDWQDPIFRDWLRYQERENGRRYTTAQVNGETRLAKQLPNSYRPYRAATRKGGQTRKLESIIANIRSERDRTYRLNWPDEKQQVGKLYVTRRGAVGREMCGMSYFPVKVLDNATLWGIHV